ncbi:hypothetical protein ACHAXT_005267 [Thalassiosira profunda]
MRFAAILFSCFVASQALDMTLPQGLCTSEIQGIHLNGSLHVDWERLGVCLHKNNHPSAADIYHHIRSSTPDYAYVLVNQGVLALKGGDIKTGRAYLLKYLEEVGGVYGEGEPTDREAKERGPPCRTNAPNSVNCANALNNSLGALEITDGKNAPAATFYLNRAIEIGDDASLTHAYANLGGHLGKLGDHDGASEAFIRSFWVNLRQGNIDAAVGSLVRRAFLVPTVAASLEETETTRIGFMQRIDDIRELAVHGGSSWVDDASDLFLVSRGLSDSEEIKTIPPLRGTLTDWTSNIQLPPFYVHYYGWHDLPLNEAVSDMFTLLCPDSLFEVAPHLLEDERQLAISPANNGKKKKRVGFVSGLIGGDEPHGLLVLDILRSLKDLFDFYVVSVGSAPLSDEFLLHAKEVYSVGYNEIEARNVLKSLELDCLVYGESMNAATVHFLGYQRFADVQILVQGSPVTSGVPAFDYFVSGDLLEHPFRTQLEEEHYSEQVVLFDGQAISFPRTQFHPRQDSALAAGDASSISNMTALERMDVLRSQDAHIYLCFQSIQKMQPSFDHVLVDILIGDPLASIALQASRSSIQTEALQRRLKAVLRERLCGNESVECPAAAKAYERIHFLPRVKSTEVLTLMQKSSVVLHPFPFGGSKTASDAINAGVPIVTYPQSYLRGRMAAVFIKSLSLGDVDHDLSACCIAGSISDYVAKAQRLASDRSYRTRVAAAISQRSDRIFDDRSVSVEWGKFLTRALEMRVSEEEIQAFVRFEPEERHLEPHVSKAMEDEQKRWRKSILLSDTLASR